MAKIAVNKCGCIVEKTDEPVKDDRGVVQTVREYNRVLHKVKFKMCATCMAYTKERNGHIADAAQFAHRIVPELAGIKASTCEGEVIATRWNHNFLGAMDDLMKGLMPVVRV